MLELWQGQFKNDCLKLKNNKGKGIRIEFCIDIATIAYGVSDGDYYVLSFIEDLLFYR